MNRQILCERCAEATKPRGVGPETDPLALALSYHLEEHVTRKRGWAIYRACCDQCSCLIDQGDWILCQSVSTKQAPYYEWESEVAHLVE